MAVWKKASAVFIDGTEQIKKLKGSRVRTRIALELSLYDPITNKQTTTKLVAGELGFVSNHHPTRFDFLLAFPSVSNAGVSNLESLMRSGKFKVVIVNEPTFKVQFEIED